MHGLADFAGVSVSRKKGDVGERPETPSSALCARIGAGSADDGLHRGLEGQHSKEWTGFGPQTISRIGFADECRLFPGAADPPYCSTGGNCGMSRLTPPPSSAKLIGRNVASHKSAAKVWR